MRFYWRDRGYLWWRCPGCSRWHGVPVSPPSTDPKAWGFSGSEQEPTLSPSLKVQFHNGSRELLTCHFFVRNGKIDFCSDSFHELSGQKGVEVEDVPEFLWDGESEESLT